MYGMLRISDIVQYNTQISVNIYRLNKTKAIFALNSYAFIDVRLVHFQCMVRAINVCDDTKYGMVGYSDDIIIIKRHCCPITYGKMGRCYINNAEDNDNGEKLAAKRKTSLLLYLSELGVKFFCVNIDLYETILCTFDPLD